MYGWVLVVTLSGLLMTAVGLWPLTAHQIWRRNVTRQAAESGEGGESGEVVLELSEGLVLERPLAGGEKRSRSSCGWYWLWPLAT